MKVPIKLAAEREVDLRDHRNVNTLRLTYNCWRRREKGEEISLTEEEFADRFEEILHEANLAGPKQALAFSKQLVKTLEQQKFRLIDRIIQEAPHCKSKEEVRKRVDAKYPGKWKDEGWKKACKVFFESP